MKNSTVLLLIFVFSIFLSDAAFAGANHPAKPRKLPKSYAPALTASHVFMSQYKSGRYPISERTYNKVMKNQTGAAFSTFAISDNPSVVSAAEIFDWADAAWSFNRKELYSYNSNGDITEVMLKDEQGNNTGRFMITYNAANMVTVYKLQRWENESWINVSRDSLVYNAQNDVTSYFSEMWYANAWNSLYSGSYTYAYDETGRITDYTAEEFNGDTLVVKEKMLLTYTGDLTLPSTEIHQQWSNNEWVNDSLVTYGFNEQNQWITITGAEWKDTAFVETERYTDVVWHNYDSQEASFYKYQLKAEEDWVDFFRSTTDYTRPDSITTTEEFFLFNWIPTSRYTEFYNELNTFTGSRYETYENDEWLVVQEFKEIHTYDPQNNIAETVYQEYDVETEEFVNYNKTVYQYGSVTASKFNHFQKGLKLYPNPVVNDAVIQLELDKPAFVSMKVIDVTGKVVEQLNDATLHAGNHQFSLNTTHLKAGVYHLQLISPDAVSTKKFVVMK